MRADEFDKLIAEGYEKLPQWVRDKIKNVALLSEDEPSGEIRRKERLGKTTTLLGYYHGMPLAARGDFYGVGATLPDTITLYRLPILDVAEQSLPPGATVEQFSERVREIVADTVWHEFAHHFGMSEKEVRLREKKRKH